MTGNLDAVRRTEAVPFRARRRMSLELGALAGFLSLFVAFHEQQHRDFGQVWFAARVLLHGANPYTEIGPGRAFEWAAPFFYPLPAALLGIPFTPFPQTIAVALFMAVSVGVLVWALLEHGYPSLLALLSTCVANAVYVGQWSPMLAGAFVLAPLSAILVGKPTIGVALFVGRPTWWAVGGGLMLLAASFLSQPHWVTSWRHALDATSVAGGQFLYTAPVALPGGPFVLLALSRWRRPEARLLVALACVPQTLLPYEGVLLFLIPRGWLECALLVASSHAMSHLWVRINYHSVDLATWVAIYGPAMVMFLYLPATVMVLLRPNEGPLPAWIERTTVRWPPWLRGRPLHAGNIL